MKKQNQSRPGPDHSHQISKDEFSRSRNSFRNRISRKPFTIASFVILLALPVACSLFQYADLTPFPEEHRTIYIHNLRNESFKPDIHIRMTRAVRNEFLRRENFILVEDRSKARFILSGVMNVYRKEGRLYDNYRNPTRYELIAGGIFDLRENPAHPLNEHGARRILSAGISARVDYSVKEGFPEMESEGFDRLADRLSRRVASSVEAEFVSRYSLPADEGPGEEKQN